MITQVVEGELELATVLKQCVEQRLDVRCQVLRRPQKPPAAQNDNEFAVFEQVRDKRQWQM